MKGKKDYLRIILDSIADGVFTVDKDWRLTSFNRSAERITGFSRDEAIGQYCYEIFRANVCMDNCALRETMVEKETVMECPCTALQDAIRLIWRGVEEALNEKRSSHDQEGRRTS